MIGTFQHNLEIKLQGAEKSLDINESKGRMQPPDQSVARRKIHFCGGLPRPTPGIVNIYTGYSFVTSKIKSYRYDGVGALGSPKKIRMHLSNSRGNSFRQPNDEAGNCFSYSLG